MNQDKHAPTFRTGKDNCSILKVQIEVTSLNQTVLTKIKTTQITALVLPTAPHLLNVRYTWTVNRTAAEGSGEHLYELNSRKSKCILMSETVSTNLLHG